MLSDSEIRHAINQGRVKVDPFDEAMIQPASLEMTLGTTFVKFSDAYPEPIDPLNPPKAEEYETYEADVSVLWPGQFVLGSTVERLSLPADLCARVEGKSSLGRLGLIVHATAGFVDPGFAGHLTLEIANLNSRPILLHAGMRICQLSFVPMSAPARRPYGSGQLGSKYQGQAGPTPARG